MQSRDGFELVAGRLCLDFTNNRRHLAGDARGGYDGLLALSLALGSLSAETAARLRRHRDRRPGAAEKVTERAARLAVALERLFRSVADDETPPEDAVSTLNQEISVALGKARISIEPGGSAWRWRETPLRLDRPLWPPVRDAAELLTDPEMLARVATCDGRDCRWLFVDTSRNRSRRWCDMAVCGNRAKARRYRQRHGG